MNKNRLEAFSDGVLAIVLTIMVLDLKVPHGDDLNALAPLLPKFSSHFAALPVAAYGVTLFMAASAYFILTRALISSLGADSVLARALGDDRKGKVSALLYAVAIPLAFVSPWIALSLYALVASIWLVPDTRIANVIEH